MIITQATANTLFDKLMKSLREEKVEFYPSDLFAAIEDALAGNHADLAFILAKNTKDVLVSLENELPWSSVCLEVYRRAFYDVYTLSNFRYGTHLLQDNNLEKLTEYLIAHFQGRIADTPVSLSSLH